MAAKPMLWQNLKTNLIESNMQKEKNLIMSFAQRIFQLKYCKLNKLLQHIFLFISDKEIQRNLKRN